MDNPNYITVAIIDYETGNLFSVEHACEYVGLSAAITSDSTVIMDADAVILPGVGAFGGAMENLKRLDLEFPLKDFIATGKPFMGVCLGLQLLFSESEEFGRHKGLGIIEGSVVRFPAQTAVGEPVKVPHIGWNRIHKPSGKDWDNSPLRNLNEGEFMYFVHSYYPEPLSKDVILSITDYEGVQFCSSISQKNVFACQFHPEKSAKAGLEIYKQWAGLIKTRII